MKRQLLKIALRVPPQEVSYTRRGFRGGSPAFRARVERIGSSLLEGYHAALDDPADLASLGAQLDQLSPDFRGFAYEGAAMALALLDGLSLLRRDRLRRFIAGPAANHIYMSLVGLGWAMARLPASFLDPYDQALAPVLWMLAIDGYGFHQGFFHPADAVDGRNVPRRFQGYERSAFDQGLGRCLWFVEGAEPERIARTVATFPAERRADLWSGVGLASCYAAGVDRPVIEALAREAAPFPANLAQGVAFAAEARVLAGIPTPETEMVCAALTGRSAAACAEIARAAGRDLPSEPQQPGVPVYEIWRRRIQSAFVPTEVSV